ncbi:unnamed protein product [Caenorhabditis angaria]|uniref:CUB domain-containing protein n=1 Tax=Caenorhabditis angaria TaxID=860376 RepID=A0A9P1J0J3_9PELO|nr:unnamed protein product [Caenorhabditis angaria]
MWKISIFLFLFHVANGTICRDGFTAINNKCIVLLAENYQSSVYTRDYFQKQCNRLGGNLVSIHNAIDNTAIAKFAKDQGNLWIGLTCSEANCFWDDQIKSSNYQNFQAGKEHPNGNCVTMMPSTGKWVSTDCSTSNLAAVCEADTCSHKFEDHCYYPIAGDLYHDEALNICEQISSGSGSLVSIHTSAENTFISKLFLDPTTTSIHIGAMISTDSESYWSDNSKWDFKNINFTSMSNGRCYSMSLKDGNWNSMGCETQLPAICKWKFVNSTCQTTSVYREETGTIYSPSYPMSYNKYRGIPPSYYDLHVTNGTAVIWFDNIYLDSKSSIELYSGSNSSPLAVIVQQNQEEYKMMPLTSPNEKIKLIFNQCESNCDLSEQYSWSAKFGKNCASECGISLYTDGLITSLNYPNNYPNKFNCTYYLRNPGGTVAMYFNKFETEQYHDFVKIYDEESGEELGSLSGTVPSYDSYFFSTGETLRIEFTTDGNNTFSGWSAVFWSMEY